MTTAGKKTIIVHEAPAFWSSENSNYSDELEVQGTSISFYLFYYGEQAFFSLSNSIPYVSSLRRR